MLLSLAAVLSLVASADAPAATDKQRILDPGYFDISVCAPQKPELPARVNKQILQGVLQFARPQVLECLTDVKARGGDKSTKVVIDSSLTEQGVKSTITGTNLTPEGTGCIQKALDAWTAQFPGLTAKAAAGKAPVAAHLELSHSAGVQPGATLGQNEASDTIAMIRLAQPSWCECYPDAAKAAPHAVLKGQFKLQKPKQGATASPSEVSFEPVDAATDKIAACLKSKVAGIKGPAPKEELQIPLNVRLLNANASEALPGATPQLQFFQFDLETSLASARLLLRDGERIIAAESFTDVATRYNQHVKGMKIDEVGTACEAMVKADEAEVADTQALTALFKRIHDFTVEAKGKDPAWATAETAAASRLPAGEKQLDGVQKLLADDKSRCAKVTAVEEKPAAKKGAAKKGKR
jgi:hypothetical protein